MCEIKIDLDVIEELIQKIAEITSDYSNPQIAHKNLDRNDISQLKNLLKTNNIEEI